MGPSDVPAVGPEARATARSSHASEARINRRQAAWVAAAVLWTLFVWVNRIRNALADQDLGGASLGGVIALSLSFVVAAVVITAVAIAVVAASARTPERRELLTRLVTAMLVWTAAVWAVRVVDIALLDGSELALMGGHDLPFVVVHAMLGVVSVVLWWIARSSLRP